MKNNKGFSLVELMVAVAMMGIVFTFLAGTLKKGASELNDLSQKAKNGQLIIGDLKVKFNVDNNQEAKAKPKKKKENYDEDIRIP